MVCIYIIVLVYFSSYMYNCISIYLICIYSEVDWWSLGIVCFELLTGWPPFFDRDFEKMCDKILNKPLRFPSKYNITQPAQHMIKGLLERDPSKRLGELLLNNNNTYIHGSGGGSGSGNIYNTPNYSSNNTYVSNNLLYNHPFFVDIHWEDVHDGKLIPPYIPVTSTSSDPTDTRNFDREFTKLPVKESICATMNNATVCVFIYIYNMLELRLNNIIDNQIE